MSSTKASVAIAAALGIISGFSASPAAAAGDEPMAIADRIAERWTDAYNRRDAVALNSLYSSNAMLLPMGHAEPVVAEPAIREYFDNLMKRLPATDYKIERRELIVLSPRAMVQGGTWSSNTLHTSGTYLAVIGQEDDGQWKLIASTWNAVPQSAIADAPPPQTGTSTPSK